MEISKLSRVKIANILALVLFINACSLVEPFVDRRRNAGERNMEKLYVGKSKVDAPAICYNKLTTSYEEVKKLADQECLNQNTGTHAIPVKQTILTCRLLLPNHLYFKCVK